MCGFSEGKSALLFQAKYRSTALISPLTPPAQKQRKLFSKNKKNRYPSLAIVGPKAHHSSFDDD